LYARKSRVPTRTSPAGRTHAAQRTTCNVRQPRTVRRTCRPLQGLPISTRSAQRRDCGSVWRTMCRPGRRPHLQVHNVTVGHVRRTRSMQTSGSLGKWKSRHELFAASQLYALIYCLQTSVRLHPLRARSAERLSLQEKDARPVPWYRANSLRYGVGRFFASGSQYFVTTATAGKHPCIQIGIVEPPLRTFVWSTDVTASRSGGRSSAPLCPTLAGCPFRRNQWNEDMPHAAISLRECPLSGPLGLRGRWLTASPSDGHLPDHAVPG